MKNVSSYTFLWIRYILLQSIIIFGSSQARFVGFFYSICDWILLFSALVVFNFSIYDLCIRYLCLLHWFFNLRFNIFADKIIKAFTPHHNTKVFYQFFQKTLKIITLLKLISQLIFYDFCDFRSEILTLRNIYPFPE